MTRSALEAPADAVLRLLDGHDLADKLGLTVQLLTTDDRGLPRITLLSAGEVLALGPAHWRLALHRRTATAQTLSEIGARCVAAVVAQGGHHLHELRVSDLATAWVDGVELAIVDAVVESSTVDTTHYAELVSGLRYRLTVPEDQVLLRWASTVAVLGEHHEESS